jgi:hypothetical protein
VVFLQHAVLGVGLFAAMVLPAPTAKLVLAAAITYYLIAGAYRRRYAAPPGTSSVTTEGA